MADRTAWTTATPVPGKGFARQVQAYGGAISLVTGDLALNKTVSLFKVPANFTIVSASVYVTDMDTDGSPALVFSVGDGTTAARIVSVSTAGQAGGAATIVAGLPGYQYTAETEILWTTTTASATAAAGTVTVYLVGYLD